MKLKDQIPSDNVDDNPSAWRQGVNVLLNGKRSARKVDPPEAVRATGNYSDKMTKTSRDDMQRTNRRGKGNYKHMKGNRKRPPSTTGGGGGW